MERAVSRKSFNSIQLFFLSLAQVHFFNSFFYDKLRTKGYDGVKRWTKNVSYEFTSTCVAPCL